MPSLIIGFVSTELDDKDYNVIFELPLDTPPQRERFRKLIIKHFNLSLDVRYVISMNYYKRHFDRLDDDQKTRLILEMVGLPQVLIHLYMPI